MNVTYQNGWKMIAILICAKNLEIYIRCQKSILMNNKQIDQPNY
jgi:hypothetical protein